MKNLLLALKKNLTFYGLSAFLIGNVNDSKNKKNSETGASAKSLEKLHLCTDRKYVSPGDIDSNVNTPGRTRTCDLRIRNPLLYPTELRALQS